MFRHLLLLIISICILQIACSPHVPQEHLVANPTADYTPYSHDAINYFSEVAFGAEFGKKQVQDFIVRWGSGMKVYITGGTQSDIDEVRRVTGELAQLTGLSIEFINQSISTAKVPNNAINIRYTTQDEFAEACGEERYGDVTQTHGEQAGFFCNNWNPNNKIIIRAYVLIDDSEQPQSQRNHLLREELTQSLGIMKDSNSYTDSVFHDSYSSTPTEFSELDKQVIKILYDNRISAGMKLNDILHNLQVNKTSQQQVAQTK